MKKAKKKEKNIFEATPENVFDSETDEVTEEAESPAPEILDAPPAADDKYNEMLDRYQRCLAEFDNYRKRTSKEMAARYDDGVRAACEKLLPLADNFERALAAHDDKGDNFYKGIEMIARQFEGVLSELGAKPIETEIGGAFDTNLHYAVAHTEDENYGENTIVEILQKGYLHKERVIRPAMVKVAN